MDVAATPAVRPDGAATIAVWAITAVTITGAAIGVVITVHDGQPLLGDIVTAAVVGIGGGLLGAFIVTRQPGNPIGWLLAVTGLSRGIVATAQAWCTHALLVEPGSWPGGAVASWIQSWGALPGLALAPLIAVLFPDGRRPGRGWRIVPVLSGVAFALVGVIVPIGMWPYRGIGLLPNAPAPDTNRGRLTEAALITGAFVTVVAMLVALACVLRRARDSSGDERQQLKWFGYGAGCAVVFNLAALVPGLAWIRLLGVVALLTGLGLGIFRYRLYDVDRLINRTVVYGLLTTTVAVSFAAIDITFASILGNRSVAVGAASAFVVALVLRPARSRLQNLVDRAFDRRTYDATRLLQRLSAAVGREPVDHAVVVTALRRALHDDSVEIYYYTRDQCQLITHDGSPAQPPRTGADPVTSNDRYIALIEHRPVDPRLLEAVIRAGAAALEHARLQAELTVQLREVQASRTRLATAEDAERRRIERDLHDGAQQRLVGLALHVQFARRRSAHSSDIDDLLALVVDQLHAGVEEIRALVHGILPSALVTSGLTAAIEDLGRPGEVEVRCDVPIRPEPMIEATAWFVACEAVANAGKYAPGHLILVDVTGHGDRLTVRVRDDGPGGADAHGNGLRNLADRVEAHGGSLSITSAPDAGTTVEAVLPCAS